MATVVIQKRIRKNRNSYILIYKEPLSGKQKYYKTYPRLKEAQQSANDLRTLLDSGKKPDKLNTKLNPMTFGEVAQSLKAEWHLRLMRNELAGKTYNEYCIWLNVLNQAFGKRILCQIPAADFEAFRDGKAMQHSNVSANKYLSIIKKVLDQGQKLKAVVENSAEEILFLSEKSHERNRFLLPSELDSLIEATQKLRGKFYLPAIIYLSAEHGASKQEILSLKWAHIDFDYDGKGLIKFYRTKNRKERTDFLMPRTKQALIVWREHLIWMRRRQGIVVFKSDHVFCRIDGTPINNFNKAWWSALRIAGIDDFHFHDLRHTFCSNLILSGVGLKEVKEMIGHGDISMTDRYTHLPHNHRGVIQKLLMEQYSKNGKLGPG